MGTSLLFRKRCCEYPQEKLLDNVIDMDRLECLGQILNGQFLPMFASHTITIDGSFCGCC